MKKYARILGIAGVLALAVVALLAAPAGASPQQQEDDPVARGEYLATVAGCIGCHSPLDPETGEIPEGMEFSGGQVFQLGPLGAVVTPNLTPTGLGEWSDEEIKAAITTGVAQDGHQLFPVMPYLHFNNMAESDVDDIIAFLRSLPPAGEPILHETHPPAPPLELTYDGGLTAPDPSDTAARGVYMMTAVIACTDCHTPVDPETGAPVIEHYMAGGQPFEGPWGIVYGGNITPDEETGIGAWTDEEIKRVLTTGVRPDGRLTVVMPFVEFQHLTDADADAIVHYLRNAVPAVSREVPAADLNEGFVMMVDLPEENAADSAFPLQLLLIALGLTLVLVLVGVMVQRSRSSSS